MNIFGHISHYFVKNKQLSFLVGIGVLLWGILSFIHIPKQYNPDIVAPAFRIDVAFPGASVDEVYNIVTKPLEDVLNEIPGVENIYSQTMHGGASSVTCEFYVGEDLEESMITLRQKIDSRLDLSPIGVGEPHIALIDPEDVPIKTLALISETIDPIELRKRAYEIKDATRTIPGVSIVSVIGGEHREFQIILDPEKMKITKTSLSEIQQALTNTSTLKDIGLIKTHEKYFTIETREHVATTSDIEDVIIVSNIEQQLRIGDVARVVERARERIDRVLFSQPEVKTKDAVYLTFAKKKGANIVEVTHAIDKRISVLEKTSTLFDGITKTIVKDEGRVAREEIRGLVINLIQAIVIVFIVLLFFLNKRAAFIVATCIPLTLLTVIALGSLFGYTMNRITLFALILSLGLLVDSATVVIENIVANKKNQPTLDKKELIPQAVSQVGVGLFLSTLTTVLAFIPMAFVTGMMGPYMGPLPFFVSAALIVALLYAYTINPWLAYVMCKDTVQSGIETHCRYICSLKTKGVELYSRILKHLLYHKIHRRIFLILCISALVISLLLPVVRLMRFRMLPKADREQYFVYVDLDRGNSIERSIQVGLACAEFMKTMPEVSSVQSFIGTPPVLDFNGLFRGNMYRQEPHQLSFKVNLTHPDKRKRTSEELVFEHRSLFAEFSKRFDDLTSLFVEDPPGPPVRATLHVKVKTDDEELLREVTYDLENKIARIPGVADSDISLLEENVSYVLSVNKRAAADADITVESIAEQLETIFSHEIIGVYHSKSNFEQEYIVLKYDRTLRDSIDDLKDIYIINEKGNHVPIARYVRVGKIAQEEVILNDDRERVAYISGEMGKRSVTYAILDLMHILTDYEYKGKKASLDKWSLLRFDFSLEDGKKFSIEFGGEWELTVKVFRDLGIAMGVAIVLIYLVLVAQFHSFRIPALIMATILLSLIGVLPGFSILFALDRIYFSATSMIGVIALAGIVVNNAIIFIEYVMQKAPQHDSLSETLIDAGRSRMRPILLTSITTILGSLVIARDPVWSGLAWSIVFGLSLSAALTLIVFPVLLHTFLGKSWFDFIREEVRNGH